jgi:hypothetical protein
VLDLEPPIDDWLKEEAVEQEVIIERLQAAGRRKDGRQADRCRAGGLGRVEKNLLIQTLDHHWKEHLATLDALRQVIHLRSYAQKKPIDEYKQEAFLLFERLLVAIREDVTRMLLFTESRGAGSRRCMMDTPGLPLPTSSPTTSTRCRATTTAATSTPDGALLSTPAADAGAAPADARRPPTADRPTAAMRRARAGRAASISIATARWLRRQAAARSL